MRIRLLAATGLVLATTLGAAAATPGPNGHNNGGLCEAAGSGSAQGQMQKQAHGAAFIGLAAAGEAMESSSQQMQEMQNGTEGTSADTSQDIQQFCGSSFG